MSAAGASAASSGSPSYFSVEDMRCHDGTAYPVRWTQNRWPRLRDTLNAIRRKWGHPLKVVSGYRTRIYNREGGRRAKGSHHVKGNAVDIRPWRKWKIRKLYYVILKMYEAGELPHLGGLGYYHNRFVHVDVRNGCWLAQWTGRKEASVRRAPRVTKKRRRCVK